MSEGQPEKKDYENLLAADLSLALRLRGLLPAYYPAPVAPNQGQGQAQAAANEQCAKSGKVAVMVEPTSCDGQNCTTRWVCR